MKRVNKIILCSLFFIVIGSGSLGLYWYVKSPQLPNIKQVLNKKQVVPALILGSGPAGMSAALYTSRAQFPTIVLAGDQPGGQLSDVRQIENWPGKEKASGSQTIEDLTEQAEHFGAQVIFDEAEHVDLYQWPFLVKTKNGLTLYAMALTIATGRIPKRLHVPGVETYWGNGIGVCTICDAPFHKGDIVGVVGGGDTAADRALQLAPYAKKVYMFVRDAKLDASGTVKDYLKNTKNIKIMCDTEIQKIEGDDKKIKQAMIKNNKTGQSKTIPLQGLYFAIGYHPNADIVKDYLKTNNQGFIALQGRTQMTGIPGVFAAGDVTDARYGKAGVASGAGVKAGMDTIDFLFDIGYSKQEKQIASLLFKPPQELQIEIKEITRKQQLTQLINDNPAVLVEFYADYCPSCKTALTNLKKLAHNYQNSLSIVKVNFEKATELAKSYKINTIPMMLFFKNGKLTAQKQKIASSHELKEFLEQQLAQE